MTSIPKALCFLCIFIFYNIGVAEGFPPVYNHKRDKNEVNELRVTGGKEAEPHSLPYQVGIMIDMRFFCGGVLISTCHVLTAAHCVDTASYLEVYLGFHDLKCKEDTQKVLYNPKVILHDHYNATSKENDIAILKLPRTVQITWAVRPIAKIADDDSGMFIGYTGILSGWGYTHHSSNHLEYRLKQVYLDIISNKLCSSWWYSVKYGIVETQVCTAGIDSISGTVGACFGDSGGPLVVNNVLVGLVSFGSEICEGGSPSVYTRISKYHNWISKYTGL